MEPKGWSQKDGAKGSGTSISSTIGEATTARGRCVCTVVLCIHTTDATCSISVLVPVRGAGTKEVCTDIQRGLRRGIMRAKSNRGMVCKICCMYVPMYVR